MALQLPSYSKGVGGTQTQLVAPDRQQINVDKYYQAKPSEIPPLVTTGTGNTALSSQALPNGLVYYRTNSAQTGSATNQPLYVPRPHRLVRIEFEQIVTSSGALDATGINIVLKREDPTMTTPASSQISLMSTNGTQAVDSVVFVFGTGWESDTAKYIITATGQNNDTLYSRIYIQYL